MSPGEHRAAQSAAEGPMRDGKAVADDTGRGALTPRGKSAAPLELELELAWIWLGYRPGSLRLQRSVEECIMGQIQPPSDKNRAQQQGKAQREDNPSEKDTVRMTAAQPGQKAQQKSGNLPSRDDLEGMYDAASAEGGDESQNEGEGSRTAAREYNEGLAHNMAEGHTEEDAKRAEEALEGPERAELERAEQEGKRGQPRHTH
jgi:hypothetical protein